MLLGVCEVGLCPNPPGALPLDPATFEKVDQTFILPPHGICRIACPPMGEWDFPLHCPPHAAPPRAERKSKEARTVFAVRRKRSSADFATTMAPLGCAGKF